MKRNRKNARSTVPESLQLKTTVKAAPKEVSVNEAVSIMANIIRQKRSQTRKDVEEWRAAWAKAEDPITPNRYKLVQNYTDALIDGHLLSQYNNRIMRISNKKFKIIDRTTKKEDELKTDFLKTKWFKDFMWYAMEKVFWGFKMVEFKTLDDKGHFKKILTVPDEHLLPNRSEFLRRPTDPKGPNFLEKPWTDWHIPVGDTDDLGLLLPLSLLAIYKRNTWSSWSEFEEIFGIPIRIAKLASTDPKVKAEVQNWMEEMGTASYGIFPMGTELDIKPGGQSDAFQVFEAKRKAINEEMSKLINGQTMTSDNGSSRSQSEVHERTENQVTLDDMSDIYYLVNDDLLPFMRLHGYPIGENDIFIWDEQEQLSITQKWTIHQGILQYFDVDPAFIEETYGIKILGKKESNAQPPLKDNQKPKAGTKRNFT